MTRSLLTALGAGVLLGAACSCGAGEPRSATRVIVLGIDGLDPEMLQERIERGLLPNFARLIAGGTFRPLQTSWPPQSPVAWSNFITGCNPGKHGLYDFIHVDRRNYGLATSMSVTEEVGLELSLFGYKLPLTGGDTELTRRWPAFWEVLDEAGVPVAVYRMPANYPPAPTGALTFPDMGTPDLAGAASGKSFLWTEDAERWGSSLIAKDSYYVAPVTVNRHRKGVAKVEGKLYGPPNTLLDLDDLAEQAAAAERAGQREEAARLRHEIEEKSTTFADFTAYADLSGDETRLAVKVDEEWALARLGGWSNWVPVTIPIAEPLISVTAWTRFLFKSAEPFELYASPLQIDPFAGDGSVSTPDAASAALAEAIGPYYTQGFPDAYKSYKAELLDTGEFVSQSDTVVAERHRMLDYALERFDRTGGLLFFYYGSLDMRCHMLWHCQDALHPHQEPDNGDYADQIDRIYRQMDEALGRLLERSSAWPECELIVMSDHGFAPFRRKMHLNDWLLQEGYLVLKEDVRRQDGRWLRGAGGQERDLGDVLSIYTTATDENGDPDWDASPIDWSRSRAYCVGFNGIILNRAGREAQGWVTETQAGPLLAEMTAKLLALRDGQENVFTRVLTAREVFHGDQAGLAPDLQLGFNVGYGASDECAQGEITGAGVIVDNDSRWSGSHLMDPELVRGTLITGKPRQLVKDPALEDLTATLYRLFDVPAPAGSDGQALYQ